MATRTYLPQLARLIMRVCMYIQKHQGKLDAVLSSDAQTACTNVVNACLVLQKYLIVEQP